MIQYVTKFRGGPKAVDDPKYLCNWSFKIPGIFILIHLFEQDLTLEDHFKTLSYFHGRVIYEFISLDQSVSLVGCCQRDDRVERKQESEHIHSTCQKQVQET